MQDLYQQYDQPLQGVRGFIACTLALQQAYARRTLLQSITGERCAKMDFMTNHTNSPKSSYIKNTS
jgi:hypothetical protein